MSAQMTVAPAPASTWALARPMPPPAPEMMATRSLRSNVRLTDSADSTGPPLCWPHSLAPGAGRARREDRRAERIGSARDGWPSALLGGNGADHVGHVDVQPRERTQIGSVTEVVKPAVGSEQPVPTVVRCRDDGHDPAAGVRTGGWQIAKELGVAERNHVAHRVDDPVAAACPVARDPGDGCAGAVGRSEAGGVSEPVDVAGRADDP